MARASVRLVDRGRIELAALAVVGVGALVLVYAMLLVEGRSVEHALHLAAPDEARPGSEIAIEGYVFDSETESGVPELRRASITVRLTGAGGDELSRTTLEPTPLDVSVGSLRLPETEGDRSLRAEARLDGEVVATATRPIHVAASAAGAPELGRTAPLLMHFSLGPIVVAEGQLPPPRFEVLVQAGVCVPDEHCTLLVDTGAVGFDVSLAPSAAIGEPAAPRTEGSISALGVVVTGMEAETDLVVRQNGIEVARRSVRFPVALATPWLDVDVARAAAGTLAVDVAPSPGREHVVLDVFQDGQWMRSITLGERHTDDLLGGEHLEPGLYRVEARADAFRTDHVSSRVVRVGAGDALPEGTRPGLRRDGLAFELDAAEDESAGLDLPAAVSGLAVDQASLEAQKRVVRYLALAAMGLAIVLVVVTTLRRGLVATAQAGTLMQLAGVPDAGVAARRARLTLALTVLAIVFAMLTAGAMVMARSLFVGLT